jgi:hypothetical protein
MAGEGPQGHGHAHPPATGTEGGWAPSGPGTVLIDIDESVGALVLLLAGELLGEEIEAEPAAAREVTGPLVHTAVRERLLPGGVVHAAVFPALAPRRYRLHVRGDAAGASPLAEVHVPGGIVTELDLR